MGQFPRLGGEDREVRMECELERFPPAVRRVNRRHARAVDG